MNEQVVGQAVEKATRIRRSGRFAVGTVHETKNCGMCEVIEHLGNNKVKVRFVNTGAVAKCRTDNLGNGLVADPMRLDGYLADKATVDAAIKSKLAEISAERANQAAVQAELRSHGLNSFFA